jgi:segregation and condensation protein B
MNLMAVLEGLLFIMGDEGLSLEQAEVSLEISREELLELIKKLEAEYNNGDRGIKIETLGNYLKLTTKKEHKEYYQRLIDAEESSFLSQEALETLAIIAYNEPVTRVKVDEIRGVGSSHMIRKLLSRNLIKELGRSELPGRPIFYGITSSFLDYFGLSSVKELPKLEETINVELEETDLYNSKYQES